MARLIVASRPLHGLGNRVRLVLSGQALAKATERRFDYYWPTGRGFGSRFTDLWEFQGSISSVASRAFQVVAPFRDPASLMTEAAASARIWHVRSGSSLPLPPQAPDWHRSLAELPLNRGLAETVRRIHAAEFGDRPYVGVMVRTHENAHELTKRHSPLAWYVDRMEEMRTEHPEIRFFLSCDTVAGAAELQRRFPASFSQQKSGGYNSAQAIQESVIDLYLLAASSHILAPHHSSFPELSHFLALGQVPLETSVGESYAQVRPPLNLSTTPDPTKPSRRVS